MSINGKMIHYSSDLMKEIGLDENLKKLLACIQCGTCTAGCPAGNWSALRTHRLMRKAITGIEDVLIDPGLWNCTTCFTCYERCPRTIPVTEVNLMLRQIAVRRGLMPEPLKGVINNLKTYGHAVPLMGSDSKWAQLRKELGLDPVPPTVARYPEALEEVQTIFKVLKFDERIPYQKKEENKE